jgi:hypothetical protein
MYADARTGSTSTRRTRALNQPITRQITSVSITRKSSE